MDVNLISQKLLADGWAKEQTPPGMKAWNDFDGGWTYDPKQRSQSVFETPCGLLLKHSECPQYGYMSYMGIDWTEENDCATITCPYYDRTEACAVNHPLLEQNANAGCHFENLHFCAVHETHRLWNYEQSLEKVQDEAAAEQERLFEEFSASRGGRVCKMHCHFNRQTKEWSMYYDPWHNCFGYCSYCSILGKSLSPKIANVFYDLKITSIHKGQGLFPDEEKVIITKGIKLLKHRISETICDAIVKTCAQDIQRSIELNHHTETFLYGSRFEVLNLRVDRRETRDLMQDLRDIADGIEVRHKSDDEKAAKAAKSERRAKSRARKERAQLRIIEKHVLDADYETLRKFKSVWIDTLGEMQFAKLCQLREDKKNGIGEQFGLFDERQLSFGGNYEYNDLSETRT